MENQPTDLDIPDYGMLAARVFLALQAAKRESRARFLSGLHRTYCLQCGADLVFEPDECTCEKPT